MNSILVRVGKKMVSASHFALCVLVLGVTLAGRVVAAASSFSAAAWGPGPHAIVEPGLTDVASIQASDSHNMFVRADGTVGGWGRCYVCQDEIPAGLADAAAVSIGVFHVLALRSNGTVLGWGDDYFGETIVPSGLSGVVAIDTGNRQSLVLKDDGTVVTWGQHGTSVPNHVQNVIAISAGKAENYFHALALKNDGTVIAWGRGDYGENNVPSGLSNVVAVAAGYFHNVALKADGTVVCWGGREAPIVTPPSGLSNVIAISAGELHTLALKSDGTVVQWQAHEIPPYGPAPVPDGLTNVVAISAGRFHSVVLIREQAPVITQQPQTFAAPWHANTGNGVKAIGTPPIFYQWQKDGANIPLATNAILRLAEIDFSDAGAYTVVVSNHIGSITSDAGVLTVTPWIDIIQQPLSQTVNASDNVTLFVTAVGSPHTYQWLRGGYEIPGAVGEALSLTNVQTEGGIYSVLIQSHGLEVGSSNAILTVNGNILPAIVDPPRPEKTFIGAKLMMRVSATGQAPLSYQWQKNGVDLAGETNDFLTFSAIQSSDAGDYVVRVTNSEGSAAHPPATLTLVARSIEFPPPGTVVSIGGPMVPPGLSDVVAIAAGTSHALALKSDGTVAAWGQESFSHYPPYSGNHQPPAGLSNVVAIAAGSGHSLALKQDGTVVGWRGSTVPANLYGVVAIAAGGGHALALKADGTVVSWGNLGVPLNGLRNVTAIAAGGQRNIALREDGTVLAWGDDVYQHVFAPLQQVTAIAAGRSHIIALREDGTIFDYFDGSDPNNTAPAGLEGVVKVAAGDSHSVGLKDDGTVTGWNGANLPADLNNIAAISAGRGFTLLLTTNPPPPMLAGEKMADNYLLSVPVSVSGYVLEVTDDLTKPYEPVDASNTTVLAVETNKSALVLPINKQKFYRLRKL